MVSGSQLLSHDCEGPRRIDLRPTTSEKRPTKGSKGEQREGVLACLFGCSDLLRVWDC
uniref:Uncharacterized protein n=1 Tax=Fagus sylvatica TaxID=28930 RepID=A0A2N9IJ76_FAGSY